MHEFIAGLIRKAHGGMGSRFASGLLLVLLALALGTNGAFAASNDNFVNALPIGLGYTTSTAVNTALFTKEVGEPAPSAGTGGASAWWVWNSGGFSGQVICSTAGSNIDTVIDVWTGSSVSSLSRVTFNDDYTYGLPQIGGAGRTSMAPFTAAANTTYYFRVDGYYNPAGGGTGNIFFALQQNPTLTIATTAPAFEGSTAGTWTVSLSSSLVDQVPVSWAITGGTSPNTHYSIAQSNPLFIPPNSFSSQISLSATDDGMATGNLTVVNTLQSAGYANYLLGNPGTATLTIVDAESPEVFVNQNATGLNNGSTWANAYTDLHQGLLNAVSGNQIWVAQGTYVTTSQNDTFQLVGGTSIYGGFAGNETLLSQRSRFQHPTTISGVYATSLSSLHVVNGADNCLIEGFTITGGSANVLTGSIDSFGGAMLVSGVSQSIRGCIFTGNKATFGGGAIYLFPGSSTPIIDSCYFVGNSCTYASSPYGGSAIIFGNGSVGTYTLSNCVFANNTTVSATGGALFTFNFNGGTMLNCTFYNNTNSTNTGAGAIYNDNTTGLSLVNSIFSSNTNTSGTATLLFAAGSTQTATSCLFQEAISPGLSGAGNIVSTNPGFLNTASLAGVDGLYGDIDDGLTLTSASPAVDSGTSTGAPNNDISNHGRPLGAGIDRGAYELTAPIYVTPSGGAGLSGNSWANATTLQHALSIALSGNQIWVAAGTYAPALSAIPSSTFQMQPGVEIYGGFNGTETLLTQRNTTLNKTILSGTASTSLHVVTGASSSRLDGCVITGGNATSNGGGGLLCLGTSPTIYGCVFTGNATTSDGGAVYISTPCSPTFKNCVFTNNTSSQNGGALEIEQGATPIFLNCTFSKNVNTANPARGGALELFANAPVTFVNCVMWGDTQPEVYINSSTGTTFAYSDIQAGVPSGCIDNGNNLAVDPIFLSPASPAGIDGKFITADDGLMLSGTSPCLNAGAFFLSAPLNDINQSSRPLGSGYDMGAYETPYVGITALIPTAAKAALSGTPTNGAFRLTRTGNLSQPLSVTLSVGGSAVPGTDYTALAIPVVFPAGTSAVNVPVPVIATSQAGATVTVVATVVPGGPGLPNAYGVSAAQSTAIVSISNLNTSGVVIIPIGGFTAPSPSNVLQTNQAAGPNASFSVQLNSQPTGNVTVNLASSNISEGTIDNPSITFTPSNWSTPVVVHVIGVNDYIAHGPQNYSVLSSGAISQDPIYNRNVTIVPVAQQSGFATGLPFVAQSGNNWQVKVNGTARLSGAFSVSNSSGTAFVTLSVPAQANDSVVIQYLTEETFTSAGGTVYDTTFPVILNQSNAWVVSVNGAVYQPGASGANGYTISNDGSGFGQVTFQTAPANGALVLVQTDEVAAQNANTHSLGVIVTPPSVSVVEGGATANYTVVLNSQPSSGNVVVNLAAIAPSSNLFTSVPSLTFTPVFGQTVSGTTSGWNVPQTVTVSATRDFNVEAPGFGTYSGSVTQVINAAAGCDYHNRIVPAVVVTITDMDAAGVVLTPVSSLGSPLFTSEFGAQTSFTVTLSSRPTGAVSLKLNCSAPLDSGSNPNGGAFVIGGTPQPANTQLTLTFNTTDNVAGSWNVPQSVTVYGLRGTVGVSGNTPYTVSLASVTTSDGNYTALPLSTLEWLTNIDRDNPGVLISAGQISVVRGDLVGQTFTVSLATDPTTGASGHPTDIVAVNFKDAASGLINISPSTVVFSANAGSLWSNPVTVTVTAPTDGVVDPQIQSDSLTYSIISGNAAYAALTGSIPVTVQDNGVAGISIMPNNGLVTTENGVTTAFDVALMSKPTGPVNIVLSSSNLGAGILSQQFYSTGTTTGSGSSVITFPGSNNLANITTSMLVKVAGLGPNGGSLSQVTAVGSNNVTVTPALNAYNGPESVFFMPAVAVASGSYANGSTVITFPSSGTDLSQIFEGQSVLITGPASFTFSSIVRYVDAANFSVTLEGAVTASGIGTVWFSAGPLPMMIPAASYQATRTVTVIGMHNFEVNGNVNYEVSAVATSSDPHYNTAQSIVAASPTSIFNYGIPFAVYNGVNWTVTMGASVLTGYTITNTAGYATVTLASPVTGTVTLTYLPTVTLTNLDVDTAGFLVTPLNNSTIFPAPAVPNSANFTVALTSEPTSDVVVQVQSSNPLKGTVVLSTLTFTQQTPNSGLGWDQPHVVTINAVGSNVADGSVSYSISMLPANSLDPNYNTLVAPGVSLATVDPRTAGITVTPSAVPIITNAQSALTGTFDVVLNSQPTGSVTIPVSSSNPAKGFASPTSLTFNAINWLTPQTVTVTGIANNTAQGDVPYQINFGQPSTSDPEYAILSIAPVSVIGRDNNMAGYIISDPTSQSGHIFSFPPDAPLQTTDLGGTAEFQIALTSQPSGNDFVTVNLASTDTTLGNPQPASVTFNANTWNQPVVVTIVGGNANNSDHDGSYSIISSSVVSAETNYNTSAIVPVPCMNIAQNKTPTLAPILSYIVNENQPAASLPVVHLTGITTGQATELNALTITAVSDNPSLIPNSNVNLALAYAGGIPAPSTGTLKCTPLPNQFGTANITVKVTSSDLSGPPAFRGGDKSVSQTFTVTVNFVNQAPAFSIPGAPDQTSLEDSGLQTVSGFASAISVGPPNEASQHGTFVCVTDNNALFSVLPEIDPATGDLTYTSAPTAYGLAHITVVLMDDGGTANGGVDSSLPATFNITVTQVNHAPSFSNAGDISVQEGAGAVLISGWATGISPGPPDESSQTLTFTCVNDNDALFSTQPAVDLAGNLTFTTLPHSRGFTNVTLSLMDSGGILNGGQDTTVQTFTITVNPVNSPPVVTISPASGRKVPIGTTTVIQPTDLFATDVDSTVPFPAHDPGLIFTLQLVPGNGVLTDNGVALAVTSTFTQQDLISGLIRYTHNGGTSSSDGFAFVVSDNAILAGSVLASPPLPAVTLPPAVSSLQVFAITIDRSNPVVVLSPAGPLPYLDQAPAELLAATATVSDPLQPSFAGGLITASFASGASSSDVITIDTTGSITLSGATVLYNDGTGAVPFGTLSVTQGASGTVLTVSSLTAAATTTSVASFIQRLTYQNVALSPSNPLTNPVTQRVMQVQVQDANSDSSQPATLAINVTSISHAPVITSGSVVVTSENVPISGMVTAVDVDGTTLTYTVTGIPALGTVVIDPVSGIYTFTPVANVTGTGGFHVHVTDGGSTSADQDITVTITSDSPLEPFITSNPPQLTTQNDTVIYNVVGTSPGTTTPTFTVIGLPAGSYTLATSGQTATLTLLPTLTATPGYLSFGILITDPTNVLSGVQPVTLLIAPTPAAGG